MKNENNVELVSPIGEACAKVDLRKAMVPICDEKLSPFASYVGDMHKLNKPKKSFIFDEYATDENGSYALEQYLNEDSKEYLKSHNLSIEDDSGAEYWIEDKELYRKD